MKIVFFGTPQFAVPPLEKLIEHSAFDLVGVVTQPDKRRGRGNQLIPSPVKRIATSNNLPVWQPKRLKKDTETLKQLQNLQADIFVVVAYGQILSKQVLEMPRLGCVNVHASLLPEYRGAAPVQWCLYDGKSKTGVTTMLMEEGMDTGPMLLKAETPIGWLDNASDVAQNLSQMGADLLVETLLNLEAGKLEPTPQNDAEASYARLIQKQDYVLNWRRSAWELHNQVRGFYPNCFTYFRGEPLKVTSTLPLLAEVLEQLPEEHFQGIDPNWIGEYEASSQEGSKASDKVGTVVEIAKNRGLIVKTGSGLLLLQTVQPAGKRLQSGWDFANGVRLEVGEKLTSDNESS